MINWCIIGIFILSVLYSIKYKLLQVKFISASKKALKTKQSYLTFLMSLGAHIGAGNIIGVTTALIYGGVGAIFWMFIATLFTTIFSLMENTLGVKYRSVIDEEVRGGSCYYIYHGLKNKKLSIIFCVFLVLSSTIFFAPLQASAIKDAIVISLHINKNIILLLLIVFIIVFVFQGTKKILKVIEVVVPFMTILFLLIMIIIIGYNIKELPRVMKNIISEAFDLKSGIIGTAIVGIKRSLFSNEAGLGTAPSINAMSGEDNGISQGYLQVLACFIDTVVMCSLLGITILIYKIDLTKFEGADLAIHIFAVIFSDFGIYLGAFFLFIFSLATVVSGFYSGESNILFLHFVTNIKPTVLKKIYKVLFIIGMILGVVLENKTIWDFIDYGLVGLGIINVVVIIRLEKVFKEELFTYLHVLK